MELFKKFRDTVFLKEENDLEKRINNLKENREFTIDKEKLDKDLNLLKLGLKGEKEIIYALKNANVGMYVLHDVKIKYEDSTAQIDFVVVTRAHCYLIECKNLYGNIYINETGEFRRDYNNRKMAIPSPYTQAMTHKDILKKIWSKYKNDFTRFLQEKAFDNFYKPLVVLANSYGMLTNKAKSKELKNSVIRVDQLVEYLKKDLSLKNDKDLYSQKYIKSIAERFLELHVDSDKDYMSKYDFFVEEEKSSINLETLKEKLKEFRNSKRKLKGVPAYYIFNDKELDDILKHLPRTIEELQNLKIIENVKIKFHGEEIIKIINDNIQIEEKL